MSDQESNEISVTKDGVTLKGDLAGDVRAPIQQAAKTTESLLRLLDNVVGLPADFISNHLEVFRDRYIKKISLIPEKELITPNLRIGCSVLKNVAYSAEEPRIQEMFAELLTSASHKEKADEVHPGFASVINEMKAEDAKILLYCRGHQIITYPLKEDDAGFISEKLGLSGWQEVVISLANLLRLGLIETFPKRNRSPSSIMWPAAQPRVSGRIRDISDIQSLAQDTAVQLETVQEAIKKQIESINVSSGLKVSIFGESFIRSCLPEKK